MLETSLSTADLEIMFGPVALEQGWRGFTEGRILVTEMGGDGELRGQVKSEDGELLDVRVHLQRRRERVVAHSYCTCSVGKNCAHAAALLWQLVERRRGDTQPVDDDAMAQWLGEIEQLTLGLATTDNGSDIAYLLLLSEDGGQPHVRTVLKRSDGTTRAYDPADVLRKDVAVRLDGADRRMLYELAELGYRPQHGLEMDGLLGAALLERLVATGRCWLRDLSGAPLALAPRRAPAVDWTFHAESSCFQVCLQSDPRCTRVLNFAPPWFIDAAACQCGPLASVIPRALSEELLCAPPASPASVGAVMNRLQCVLAPWGVVVAKPPVIEAFTNVHCQPVLCLATLSGPGGAVTSIGKLSFNYAGERVDADCPDRRLVRRSGDRFKVVTRALALEEQAIVALMAAGLVRTASTTISYLSSTDQISTWTPVTATGWPYFMVNGLLALKAIGWALETERGFAYHLAPSTPWLVSIEPSSERSFKGSLMVDLSADLGGEHQSLWPAIGEWWSTSQASAWCGGDAALRSEPDVPLLLTGGVIVPAPGRRLERVRQVLEELGVTPESLSAGRVQLSRFQAAALVGLDAPHLGLIVAQDDQALQLGKRIAAFSGIRALPEPPGLGVTLRPYQRQALGWFAFLAEIGSGGCLADDMGLGKTVQTLAHLLVEKLAGRVDRPSLVVAPTSVLGNWVREANRVTPQLRVLLLHGPNRHTNFSIMGQYDVCITSYALLSRDAELLRQQPFHLVVLDEAQNIKNPRTRAAMAAGRIDARRMLALTGTPLENHLGELWGLFSVLVPGLLGSERSFRSSFRRPVERDHDSERGQLLARRLAPFMLRRTKASVTPELPPKTEILHRISLLPDQARVYEQVRQEMTDRLTRLWRERGVEESRVEVLSALLRLRQVCCDPRLMAEVVRPAKSAKLELLLELVPTLLAAGHRILVFSQFKSMLILIADALREQLGVQYLKLTGDTRDRQKLIDDFQTGRTPIFLVSLKAGGTGLNLTAADTVIHYDPWWNPAAAEQASDRAHRIGQTHPVFIHKLLTEGTVEERIHDMQINKQRLADGLFEGRGATGLEWTAEQLSELLAPIPE